MADVYKIGVLLSLKNGVSDALRLIQRDLFHFNRQVDLTTGKLNNMQRAAIGAMEAIAGIATVKMTFKVAKIGDEFVRAQNRLVAAGVSPAGVSALSAAAQRAAVAVPGTLPSEALNVANELRASLGGNISEITSILQPAMRELIGLQQHGVNITSQAFAQNIKSLDLMGGAMKNGTFNPATFAKNLHYLDALEIASHGLITPSTMLQFARLGGFTVQGTDFRRSMAELFTPIMELGSRAGSGAAYAAMQFLGGNASIKTIHGMQRYHLIGPGAYVHEAGHYAVNPGALYGYRDLMDPRKGFAYWIQHDLVPKLNSEGIRSTTGVIAALSQIIGSVRAARFLMSTTTPAGQALQKRDMAIYEAAAKANAYQAAQGNLSTNLTNLSTAWTGFVQAIGAPLVPVAVKDLKALTGVVLDLEKVAWAHPGAVKLMGETAAGLGALLTVMGTLKVAGAAFAATRASMTAVLGTGGVLFEALSPEGWLVLGFAALASALGEIQPSKPLTAAQQKVQTPANLLFPGLAHGTPGFPAKAPVIPPGWHPKHVESGWLQGFIHMMTAKPAPQAPVTHHLGDIPYTTWESIGPPPVTSAHGGPTGTANNPLHVLSHITNPSDIHNGMAKAMNHHLDGRQHGTSGFDYSLGAAPPAGAY